MKFLFEIGDLIKDKDLTRKRIIKCAKIIDMEVDPSGHESLKLLIYDSNTGTITNLWMDQYRFRKMNDGEIKEYKQFIKSIDDKFKKESLDNECFEEEKEILLDYFKPVNDYKALC